MSPADSTYHHGDLPAALVRAAIELLDQGGAHELSLRAAARRAGVSIAAPYRHFADRQALLSAVAAVGFRELAQQLMGAHPAPRTAEDLASLAVGYVEFALRRPGLFRVMFVEPSGPGSPDQDAAVGAIHDYLAYIVGSVFPDADPEGASTAMWALVHGLAFLHLDGKLDTGSSEIVADRVRRAVYAVLAMSGRAAPG